MSFGTSMSSNVYYRIENEPYGKVWALRAGDVHQPLRLPGQVAEQFDTGANGATERSYNNFRWYRPGWGIYSQEDPIGITGGLNAYEFAGGNPSMRSDSLGLRFDGGTPTSLQPYINLLLQDSPIFSMYYNQVLNAPELYHLDDLGLDDGEFNADVQVFGGTESELGIRTQFGNRGNELIYSELAHEFYHAYHHSRCFAQWKAYSNSYFSSSHVVNGEPTTLEERNAFSASHNILVQLARAGRFKLRNWIGPPWLPVDPQIPGLADQMDDANMSWGQFMDSRRSWWNAKNYSPSLLHCGCP